MTKNNLLTLSGSHTQVIVEVGDVAEIVHWGKKVQGNLDSFRIALQRPVPYGCLDTDIAISLAPEHGRGVFSSPAIEGHRSGKDWSPVFSIVSIKQSETSIIIESADKHAGLRLVTELNIDEHDVLKSRHTLTNTASGLYQVNRLANTLPLPARANELMTYYGRWIHEFQTTRQPLKQGGYQQENRRGRTSHEHYPAMVVGTSNFNEMDGDVWGIHFAWSGNHRLRADVKADGRRYVQGEVIYFAGEIALEKGESITTPWLYSSYSSKGLNGMSQQFHSHVRQSILSDAFSSKPRPIHLNTWEGIYFDHDPEYIMEMATQASKMGIERFIIDDGWFKGRTGDTSGLGDWYLDDEKYPYGIGSLISHVNQLGMEFGLWFEPEMVNKNSDMYRQHPDWLLEIEGYDQPTGRNQYVVDLQNEDAFRFLFERLDHFLATYNIAYIKWDMNREVVQPAHLGKASAYQQTKRYYQLVDKVREKYPNVEIESCAAGGGRIDYEVLKRTQRFWASDNNDALERQTIQRGMSYFYPPEVMGSHIGASSCHSTRRQHSIGFRGLTALFGHMGIELDPVKECQEEKEGFEHYIRLHKELRALLHSGTSWRIPSEDTAHQIHGVVSKDKSQAIVMIAQLAMPTNSLSGHLRIPGLDSQAIYRVSVIDKPTNFEDIVNYQPPWTESGCELSGEWCEEVGLTIPILDTESAILIMLERVD